VAPGAGLPRGTAAGGVSHSEGRYSPEDEETQTVNGELAGKHTGEEKRRGEGQTVKDSLNQVYHNVEDEEGYLVVMVFRRVAGNLTSPKFGARCRALGVAVHDGVCRYGTSASRRTAAYILLYSLRSVEKRVIFLISKILEIHFQFKNNSKKKLKSF
jgi:hypothetical protein